MGLRPFDGTKWRPAEDVLGFDEGVDGSPSWRTSTGERVDQLLPHPLHHDHVTPLTRPTRAPATAGTFPTHGRAFTILLIATILIIGALTFLPVLALGPIAEQVTISAGQTF